MSLFSEKAREANRNLFMDSSRGFATVVALIATLFLVPLAWQYVEEPCAQMLTALYGNGTLTTVLFWAVKLGAYALCFYALRMSLVTAFVSLAFGAAMRFV